MYRLSLVLLVSLALILGLGVAFANGGPRHGGGFDLNLEDIAVLVMDDSAYTGPSETETENETETETENETATQSSTINIIGPSACQSTFIWGVSQSQFIAQSNGNQSNGNQSADAENGKNSCCGKVEPISAALALGGINGNLAVSYQNQVISTPQYISANVDMLTTVEVELEKEEIELEDIELEDISLEDVNSRTKHAKPWRPN